MLRIRGGVARPPEGAFSLDKSRSTFGKPSRLRVLGLIGVVLGAGTTLVTASLVLAEDDAGIRAFHRQEANKRASHGAPAASYAPAGSLFSRSLFAARPNGRIPHPRSALAPSAPHGSRPAVATRRGHGDAVAGITAAAGGRTICVRLCDGFHIPIGQLRAQADIKAHEALCEAQNPGVPVRLFRLPSGATTPERAVSADGGSYSALPTAYAYEKSSEPTCRPAIAGPGERRVSLLRDITLRPGDAVVLDGKVTTFAGSSNWPYHTDDFRDFRQSGELSSGTRRLIDEKVGISQAEAEKRLLRQSLRVSEAPRELADVAELRGTLGGGQDEPAQIRQVLLR